MSDGRKPNILNNLPLSLKIGSGIGALLVLVVTSSQVGTLGLSQFRTESDEYRKGSERALLVSDLQEDMLEARLAATKFRATTDPEAIEKVTANLDEIRELAEPAIGTLVTGNERIADLRRLIDLATRYGERFEDVAAIETERDGRIAQLAEEGRAMRATVRSLGAEGADVLAGRALDDLRDGLSDAREMAASLAAGRDSDAQALRENIADASAAARTLADRAPDPATRATLQELTERLRDYREGFDQVAEATAERDAIFREELDVIGPQIVDALDDLSASIRDEQAASLEGYRSSADVIETTTFSVAVGAIALALVIGFAIVRMTTRPVRTLTRRFAEVAEGQTDFTVREDNSADDIGRMWAALGELRKAVRAAYTRARMIEQLPTPVLVADPNDDLKVTYANDAALASLGSVERHLPFSARNVEGHAVDTIFRHERLQREVLKSPSQLPVRATVDLGGEEYFEVVVSAVHDRAGAYTGALVSWSVVTQKLHSTEAFETNVKASADQIANSFAAMRERIEAVAHSTERTRDQLASGSAAVNQATSNVQMVASAAEELSSSITEIASNLGMSSERARNAANETGEVAGKAQELASASERIGKVVDTIAEIAGQTNLLALNATIEAARAGDAGKGFAVVANEVKNLAQQTERATDEVKGETAAVLSLIDNVVAGITSVSAGIEEITNLFSNIAATADEQQAATREITENAHHAADEAETAARSITEVERLAADNQGSAEALTSAAHEISAANENFARQSDDFLRSLRAA